MSFNGNYLKPHIVEVVYTRAWPELNYLQELFSEMGGSMHTIAFMPVESWA
jgi:hypothetical protein